MNRNRRQQTVRFGLVACLLLMTRASAAQRIELRRVVMVRRDRVLLSDLLPGDARLSLREASAVIDLGPSPQLGTARVLEREWLTRAISSRPELVEQLDIPDVLWIHRRGFPVTPTALADAIWDYYRESGESFDLDTSRMQWDRSWETADPNPSLEVSRAFWNAARGKWELSVRVSGGHGPGVLVECTVGSRPPHDPAPATRSEGPPLIEAGSKGWLIVQSGSIRLRVQVVCLESGALGQYVRVRPAGGTHAFRALVIGDKLLQAEAGS
jgi:hypothetical protein